MEKKNKFKVVSVNKTRYILPSVLTLIGVCLGISSIKFSMDGNYGLAVLFIIVAAILDGLDGRVARMIKGTSEFGKELDSLTDFVSFGIAPVFVIYFWELNRFGKIGWLLVLLFSVCCVLRLARFNLTKIQKEEEWKVNYFEGIPSPAGGILVLMPLIFELSSFNIGFEVKNLTPYLAIIISILLISKIPTFSFKKIAIQRRLTIFLFLGIGIISISLIFYTFETLVILGLIYFFLIPIGVLSYKKNVSSKNFTEDEHEDIL